VLVLRPAQVGVLVLRPAQAGVLVLRPAQAGVLVSRPAQVGVLILRPAQAAFSRFANQEISDPNPKAQHQSVAKCWTYSFAASVLFCIASKLVAFKNIVLGLPGSKRS